MNLLFRRPDVVGRPPRPVLVARPGGGLRRLAALDPVDAAAYRGLVARVAPLVERRLGPRVVANRVTGGDLRLEDWRLAHRRWRRATARTEARGLRLRLDLADCYGSIRPEIVEAVLRQMGGEPHADLIRFLHEIAERDVPGLPVGPDASAVLANAVLGRVDAAVADAGAPHVRWVDDLVVGVESPRHATRVLDAVRRELAPMHLRLQETKTLLEDTRAGAASRPSRARVR